MDEKTMTMVLNVLTERINQLEKDLDFEQVERQQAEFEVKVLQDKLENNYEVMKMDEKQELAKQIFSKCMEIQGIGESRLKEDGKPCIFFNFSGHVGSLFIQINETGYEDNETPDVRFDLYYNAKIGEFQECLDYLTELQYKI